MSINRQEIKGLFKRNRNIKSAISQCAIQGQHITKQLQIKLCNHINGITIQQHWAKKGRYGKGNAYIVDWDAADQAMQTIPQAQCRWVAKKGKVSAVWKKYAEVETPNQHTMPMMHRTK